MKTYREPLEIRTTDRGLVEITEEVAAIVHRSGVSQGLAHVFCQHTSASLVVMENADPSAQRDLERYFERIAPDGDPRYEHALEGPDDMAAHLRMVLTRTSETLPICHGALDLGTWQGLFLWEHRTHAHCRHLAVTIQGD